MIWMMKMMIMARLTMMVMITNRYKYIIGYYILLNKDK